LHLITLNDTHTHTNTHAHSVGLLWTSDQHVQKHLPNNTQHSQQIDILTPGRIRTRNPSKRAAADPRLRSRGHWVRPR